MARPTEGDWPSFDALPVDRSGPPGNSWGLWGKDDELGMLNHLTPDAAKRAAQEVVHGVRIPLDHPLDKFSLPAFGRQPFHQEIRLKSPRSVNDDILTFNTQTSTQWDGFRHYGNQKMKLYYNGRNQDAVSNTLALGTHNWVQAGGIFGRGVLIDYLGWAESQNIEVKGTTTTSITLKDILAVAEHQGLTFQPGDIFLIRTGWAKSFFALSPQEVQALFAQANPPAIGLESSEELLRWLWENRFAAVAGDQPSFEAWPCQDLDHWLHEWLLAGWGMPIGELFDLEKLAEECKRLRKWSFLFSSMPLHVPGGVASPPNSFAVL
ncbi:putative cyclase-domain-containing protein [Xylariales sp. PMI_506]|nr:putative cyclase-domain-containing protein [Xylariales sp. PMI_506]